jgi:hypothetical protein
MGPFVVQRIRAKVEVLHSGKNWKSGGLEENPLGGVWNSLNRRETMRRRCLE